MKPKIGRASAGFGASLALLSALTGATGCSILEEIDNIGSDTKSEVPASNTAEAQLSPAPDGSNRAKLRAYYNRKSKIVEEDPDNPIVNCRLAGGLQFMRKYDCTLRGGRVKG